MQPPVENYANPKTCLFHVLFKGAALAFYILSALFFNSFVIIFVVTVLLAALDFWVVKNVSGRILVGLRWWNEINDLGESVWKFESLDQESLARMNKKDSWLFWWTLYLAVSIVPIYAYLPMSLSLFTHRNFSGGVEVRIGKNEHDPNDEANVLQTAAAWLVLGIFSLIRFQADYLLVVGVCLSLNAANIIGFTKCKKDAKKQFQQFASQTIASRFQSTVQSAFTLV
ncbi:hypothetical protein YC2023_100439 [Brassica napus]